MAWTTTKDYFRQMLDERKKVPLNIGIIGNSDTDRLSFINAIRGLNAEDEGTVRVDMKENIMERKAYPHPKNKQLKFWDLSGVGILEFYRGIYFEEVDFDKYDFFLIISSNRFTGNDKWLGKEIAKKKKQFFFVRTRINDEHDHLTNDEEKDMLNKIREDIRKDLGNLYQEERVFLIDSYQHEKYDFERLECELMNNCLREAEIRKCKEEFNRNGMTGIQNYFRKKLEEWKKVPLNIGVIGNSGTGKSSFINTIRGLTAEDEEAAPIGVTETTTEPKAYPHPNNKLLEFWDLPGVGTPNFPKDGYLEKISFDKYDFFLIISSNRFTENDIWLGKEIAKKDKHFFFARTKIDDDIRSNKRAYPKYHNEKDVLHKIREDIRKNLGALYREDKVFLIDNYERAMYDFEKLEIQLIKNFPSLKQKTFILSASALSEEVVKRKVEVLRQDIWGVCFLPTVKAAIPIPDFYCKVDVSLILKQNEFYFHQLGLNRKSLERAANMMVCTMDEILPVVKECENRFLIDKGVTEFIKSIQASVDESMGIAYYIPFIGSLLGAGNSYNATYKILDEILTDIEKIALRVIRIAVEKSSNMKY